MKAKCFNSFEAYEKWTGQFENASDYQEIPVVIDDGWKVSLDLFTECKSWKTALKRFAKIFSGVNSEIPDWIECIRESCESGYFRETTGWMPAWTEDPEKIKEWSKRGTYSWGIEETGDHYWYIYLNISGVYAGREETGNE